MRISKINSTSTQNTHKNYNHKTINSIKATKNDSISFTSLDEDNRKQQPKWTYAALGALMLSLMTGVQMDKNNKNTSEQMSNIAIENTQKDIKEEAPKYEDIIDSLLDKEDTIAEDFTDIETEYSKEELGTLKRSKAIMEYIIAQSCRLKAEIVEQDEKEAGIRKLLNFGHTAAHGIESDSNYKIHHGFAVALGMIYESKYALQNGYTDKETYEAVYGLLKSLKYPTHYEPKDIDKMLEAVSKDKKAGKNGISVAFSGKNMQGIIINDIKPKELIDLFL